MARIVDQVAALDWASLGRQLDAQGHVHLRGLLPTELARALAAAEVPSTDSQHAFDAARAEPSRQLSLIGTQPHPDQQQLFDTAQYGQGELSACITAEPNPQSALSIAQPRPAEQQAFRALNSKSGVQQMVSSAGAELVQAQTLPSPLPTALQQLCAALHEHLQPIAERWRLRAHDDIDPRHPRATLQHIHAGGHQDLQQADAESGVFPLAITAVLNTAGQAFRGGDWIFVEQRPRMQSRPMVIQPQLGDVVIYSNADRPLQCASGYTRARLRHGISRVHSGVRIGLQLNFHRSRNQSE